MVSMTSSKCQAMGCLNSRARLVYLSIQKYYDVPVQYILRALSTLPVGILLLSVATIINIHLKGYGVTNSNAKSTSWNASSE